MESSRNTAPAPIDLAVLGARFSKTLKRTWLLVLVLCVLMAGINLVRGRIGYNRVYRCQAIFSIGSNHNSNSVFNDSTLYYDNAIAQELVQTFPELLKTDYMRDMIQVRLGTDTINGSISAVAIADTNLMELVVTSTDPQSAYDILNAVIDCYPQAAKYMADSPSVELLDAPILPTEPINHFSPSKALATGAIAGLALGLLLTLVLSTMNRTIVSISGLKQLTNLPILATFTQVARKKRRNERSSALLSAADNDRMAESLRTLRTKVRKLLADKGGKIVLLTSTVPGEGKTTISTNLAISLAAEGHRVVLVDADLRNQTIARLFRSSQEDNGLMYCLNHPEVSVLDTLKSVSGTRLFYLSGSSTTKRHYSIDGKALHQVLDTLCDNFDYVIIDTPPCSVVSDTSLLTRFADTVLYVIKLDVANQNQLLDAITSLHQRDIPLGGCIVNGAPVRQGSYGYGYGYGYGSSYYKRKHHSRYSRPESDK